MKSIARQVSSLMLTATPLEQLAGRGRQRRYCEPNCQICGWANCGCEQRGEAWTSRSLTKREIASTRRSPWSSWSSPPNVPPPRCGQSARAAPRMVSRCRACRTSPVEGARQRPGGARLPTAAPAAKQQQATMLQHQQQVQQKARQLQQREERGRQLAQQRQQQEAAQQAQQMQQQMQHQQQVLLRQQQEPAAPAQYAQPPAPVLPAGPQIQLTVTSGDTAECSFPSGIQQLTVSGAPSPLRCLALALAMY